MQGAIPIQRGTPDSGPAESLDMLVAVTRALGDQLRARVLKVLAENAFGVLELCELFDMAQPAMSHHLKLLHQSALVERRKEGTRVFYHRTVPDADSWLSRLFAAIDATAVDAELERRVRHIYRQRQAQSDNFFRQNAQALQTQQTLISDCEVYAERVIQAWQRTGAAHGSVLEVGPGSGHLLTLLAEHFTDVLGIDSSPDMLAQTRQRVAGLNNVRLRRAPFDTLGQRHRFDLICAAMVLHHMPAPAEFFRRAATMLRAGGALIIVDLVSHDHEWAREACGDLWLGFSSAQLDQWAATAGLASISREFTAQANGFGIQLITYQQQSAA